MLVSYLLYSKVTTEIMEKRYCDNLKPLSAKVKFAWQMSCHRDTSTILTSIVDFLSECGLKPHDLNVWTCSLDKLRFANRKCSLT